MRHSHMGAAPRVYGMNHMGAAPRVYGMSHLGRSVLDVSTAKGFNNGSSSVKPLSAGIYGNTGSDRFIKDLWTAQVLALWTSNGSVYKRYAKMEGIVTRNGHNPSDVSPLGIGVDGVATTNLKSLLNEGSTSTTYVKGPDGMFGPSANSLIAEWAGTGKLFGKTLSGNAVLALNRLAENISTPLINEAKAKRAAGNPPPPKTETVATPCSQLIPEARAARADCTSAKQPGGGKPGGGRQTTPRRTATSAEGDNTLLYAGIAGAVLLLGGVSAVIIQRRKKSRGI